MKPKQEPQTDPMLDRVLRQWVVRAPLPPRFQEQVWARIGREESAPDPGVNVWRLLRRLVELNLPRPRFAYSYVAFLLVVGVATGAWAAQRETSRLKAALGSRYVQSVDPYHQVEPTQ